MFVRCESLKELNILNFDTSNVTGMMCVFSGCYHLSSFKGIENWDMSNVYDISGMFEFNDTIKVINELENWKKNNIVTFWNTFDYFPSKLPDGIKGYRLDFFPSILQGDGYTTISFEAYNDVIDQYMNEYSKDAIFTCSLADLGESLTVRINENGANPTNKVAYVRMNNKFRAKCSNNAKVYIMYNNETSHRSSYTSAVVIDSEHNLIEFSKIG